ncbi:MAG: hypothetical protein WC503_02195 [Candidatus Shapirobacteria bacterium]
MKVYVFGNINIEGDGEAIKFARNNQIEGVKFIYIDPNDDLPISNEGNICILDTMMGIEKVTLFSERDIDKLEIAPRTTAHDYDLGFQLKYLVKLGKIKRISMIALPMDKKLVDYERIHLILRKLVAQDIQGS